MAGNPQDVVIVGGGPAGAIAGLAAARAGARVRILDRATFPRHKLCGDSLNPGALAVLRRLGISAEIEARGLPVGGMIVSGEGGVTIVGRYPQGLHGRSILRRHLDSILLDAAVAAGCEVETGVVVRRPIVDARGAVTGVVVASRGGERTLHAPVVVAADGRRSRLAFGLGLARHPAAPRRWAVGAYFADARRTDASSTGASSTDASSNDGGFWRFGEMHVRKHCYIGVAPVPGDLTNVCVVLPATTADAAFRDPAAILRRALDADPLLRDRFAAATPVAQPVVLGPLAVDPTGRTFDGLLVAGDAAGFIDPMTGDGLHFAIRGGELAADAALRALEHGWTGIHTALAIARRQAFVGKWRFNRTLRALVASPRAVVAAAFGARLAPAVLRAVIARAGDCDLAR